MKFPILGFLRPLVATSLFACAFGFAVYMTYDTAAPFGRSDHSAETRYIANKAATFLVIGVLSSGLVQSCCVSFGLISRGYVSYGEICWYLDGLLFILGAIVSFLKLDEVSLRFYFLMIFAQGSMIASVPLVLLWRLARASTGSETAFPELREWLASILVVLAASSFLLDLYVNPLEL
jgi:hypothetical protein